MRYHVWFPPIIDWSFLENNISHIPGFRLLHCKILYIWHMDWRHKGKKKGKWGIMGGGGKKLEHFISLCQVIIRREFVGQKEEEDIEYLIH